MQVRIAKTLHREISRVALLVVIGAIMIALSPALALATNTPALSPWGLFIGGAFITAAVSHIMRRALFPQLDLQLIAKKAVSENNIGAALVFIGVCLVLTAFVFTTGSMLRL